MSKCNIIFHIMKHLANYEKRYGFRFRAVYTNQNCEQKEIIYTI